MAVRVGDRPVDWPVSGCLWVADRPHLRGMDPGYRGADRLPVRQNTRQAAARRMIEVELMSRWFAANLGVTLLILVVSVATLWLTIR